MDSMKKAIIWVGIIFALIVAGGLMLSYFGSTTVTLNGVDFNIPAGYEEIPDRQEHSEEEFGKLDGKVYTNDQNKTISIGVMEIEGINNLAWTNEMSYDGYDTINGKEGKYSTSNEYGYEFIYLEDGKSVIVVADDKETVSEVVV